MWQQSLSAALPWLSGRLGLASVRPRPSRAPAGFRPVGYIRPFGGVRTVGKAPIMGTLEAGRGPIALIGGRAPDDVVNRLDAGADRSGRGSALADSVPNSAARLAVPDVVIEIGLGIVIGPGRPQHRSPRQGSDCPHRYGPVVSHVSRRARAGPGPHPGPIAAAGRHGMGDLAGAGLWWPPPWC